MPTTNYSPAFARASFMDEVSYQIPYYDYQLIQELDPLSPTVHDFINRLTEFTRYPYVGEQLTTLAFQAHGTTTTVWIILMVNGLLSRTELQPGMQLLIPTLGNMLFVMQQMKAQELAKTHAFGSTIL